MRTLLDTGSRRNRRQGSAVIVVLMLLSILMIIVGASFVTAKALNQEVKLMEKQQQKRLRLADSARGTNQVTTVQFPATALRPAQNNGPE